MAYYSTAPSYASKKHLSAFQLQTPILRICLFKLEEFGAPGSLQSTGWSPAGTATSLIPKRGCWSRTMMPKLHRQTLAVGAAATPAGSSSQCLQHWGLSQAVPHTRFCVHSQSPSSSPQPCSFLPSSPELPGHRFPATASGTPSPLKLLSDTYLKNNISSSVFRVLEHQDKNRRTGTSSSSAGTWTVHWPV